MEKLVQSASNNAWVFVVVAAALGMMALYAFQQFVMKRDNFNAAVEAFSRMLWEWPNVEEVGGVVSWTGMVDGEFSTFIRKKGASIHLYVRCRVLDDPMVYYVGLNETEMQHYTKVLSTPDESFGVVQVETIHSIVPAKAEALAY